MIDAKPWYASLTVWSSVTAIGAGFGTAYYGFITKDPTAISTGLTAAFGGIGGLVGRFKADTAIGKPAKPAA